MYPPMGPPPPGYGGPPQPPPGGMPPGMPPGGMPPGGMPYGGYGYEFNEAENQTIASAALWSRILGIVLIVIGTFALFNCNIIDFALKLVVGIFMITGGSSLAMVVKSQGTDIPHMMGAMQKLGTAFKIRVIATIVGLVIVLGLFLLAMVIFVFAAASSKP